MDNGVDLPVLTLNRPTHSLHLIVHVIPNARVYRVSREWTFGRGDLQERSCWNQEVEVSKGCDGFWRALSAPSLFVFTRDQVNRNNVRRPSSVKILRPIGPGCAGKYSVPIPDCFCPLGFYRVH